ncbi:Transcriptional corepressor SEUSS like [Actinidia chinensis var. chinensis]|uniref:Transcriptional corepressor SEUSS like n=1 Tax=Actinidia chinensis var. chinensis TaxID=1590841 RepID=A0A2R6R2J4_ACTCC|nr:Transcriptional corepressor SEUSS like [Actinidia chinensis var. chinensis]
MSNNTDLRTTMLSFGENLSRNSLLPLRRKNGVFLCMEAGAKQLEFSLRMYGTVKYATVNLVVDLATVEVLPRLFKIKYESGTLEELLYVDMPREYQNSSGQIILDYAKAIQESIFEQLRVVRDGQLRIVFSPDLKICSWEFCARRHEELIPRRLLIPQVSQLGLAAQKYQAVTQNASSNLSVSELQNNCNMFVASARQLGKALEVPLVNDLGYTKRYVRCLQISEVVNSMKDLIDYSRETGIGPMESLAKFPRRTNATSGFHGQPQQTEEQLQQWQQTMGQNSNNDQSSVHETAMQVTSTNGMPNVNNSRSSASIPSSTSAIVGLLHQNSMNSRQQNPMNNANSPYGGSGIQNRSPVSSSMIPHTQPKPSPFQSPTPSSSNNAPQTAHMSSANSPNISMQQPALSGDPDPNDSEKSLAKFPRRTNATSGFHGQPQQTEEQLQQWQQTMGQNSNNDQSSVHETAMQVTSTNGMPNVNNSRSSASIPSSTSAIVGLLHQNSMNSRQQNPMNNANSPYGGSGIQNRSPVSSSMIPHTQPKPSPFQSPTPSSSNNAPQTAHMSSANSPNISMQQPALSGDPDPNDSESSVQKIIQEMMMNSSPLNGGGGMGGVGTLGNDAKNANGTLPTSNSVGLNGSNCLVGNGNGVAGFGGVGSGGLGQSPVTNGIRVAMGNSSMSMNGRIGTALMARDQTMNQQALGDHLLSGLGPINGFNNHLQFDWKSSP